MRLEFDVAHKGDLTDQIVGRRGDNQTVLEVAIYNDGIPYDFTDKYLELRCIRPTGADSFCEHDGIDPRDNWVHLKECCEHIGNSNKWKITLPDELTAYDGLVKLAYFVIKSEDDQIYMETTNGFLIYLEPSATAEAHVGPYSDQLDRFILEAELLIKAWHEQMDYQAQAFEEAQQERERIFNESEQARADAFDQSQTERAEAFEQEQTERSEAFATAQTERQRAFEDSENARQDAFVRAETARQDTYEKNETQRQAESEAAVERANNAAEIVEEAFKGQFDPAIEFWISNHLNQDVPLGLLGYQKWLENPYLDNEEFVTEVIASD